MNHAYALDALREASLDSTATAILPNTCAVTITFIVKTLIFVVESAVSAIQICVK